MTDAESTRAAAERDPLRLGVVGLGAMGSEMLAVAAGHPDVVVTIAADLNAGTVEDHRSAHPRVRFTTDPYDVVNAADIDALYVATPPAHHAELVVAALGRGVAVFCEKPLAVDRGDAEAMIAAADASGLPAFVNYSLSDRHAVLEVERALRDGEVGEVVGVDVRLRFPRWPRDFQAGATWLARREQGGFLREVFSHFAYVTDRLVGPLRPVDVSADLPRHDRGGAEVGARGLLRAGDIPVHLSAFAGVAGAETYEWALWGTRRSYLLRDWSQLLVSDGGDWVPVTPPGDRGSEATRLTRFVRAVRGEKVDHLADFAAAYRVQQAVEAFHTSAAAG